MKIKPERKHTHKHIQKITELIQFLKINKIKLMRELLG